MSLIVRRIIGVLILAQVLVCCANRGSPSGGEEDRDPPIILRTVPENFSTNFKSDEIKIYFDEYVKINDARKQLIISPPMDTEPALTPIGGASKYITIKIKDTLKENTTYAFNFGESIVDNNEGNPYPYYRYVFSTGSTIDSLSLKGFVVDALEQKPDDFISVMLYEMDSTYTDSIVFKEKPRYVTNTLDSLTSFSIDNIKEGTYRLIALKDKNSNYLFDQKSDKIGFEESVVRVPKDTTYKITMFKEEVNFKADKPKQAGATKIIFPYEGDFTDMRIKILADTPKDYKTRITKDRETDTLYYWYKPKLELDSTLFVVTNRDYLDTLRHRFRDLEADSLKITSLVTGTMTEDQSLTYAANVPLTGIDTSKITLMDKDSLVLPFRVEYDSILNTYKLPFKTSEGQKYSVRMLPGTFTDFYDGINLDTLRYSIRTKMKSEYGNIRVNLRNATLPLIVQLVNGSGEVEYERYAKDAPVVDFFDLSPAKYVLRVIHDTNGNQKYDTGNYLLGIQPERVSYSPEIDETRSNFDQIIEFILLD